VRLFLPSCATGAAEGRATSYQRITTYNNYYEFGTGKDEPAEESKGFKTSPWKVKVDGSSRNRRTTTSKISSSRRSRQERVYRMRCVEAWSMVIPWWGFPSPTCSSGGATSEREVRGVHDAASIRSKMPGQNYPSLKWPYVEGLRLDEAMHPLAILATGIYNKPLLPQNGAPLRLVTPWKYGFKGGKSIVRIRLTDTEPSRRGKLRTRTSTGFTRT
jgi:sulfoxide reductase catalytic subunit YedY